MGDGVLAYFGYPQAHEHDAEQAVRAGLALIDRVGRLESNATALASRVGIATGLVVVGDLIGSGEAQERGLSARRRTSQPVYKKWHRRTRCWSQKARGGWLAIFSTTAISELSRSRG